jgi:RNA polymerase sigma-70 factor (ECF subfamily)
MSSHLPEPLNNLADEVLAERFQTTGEMMYFEEIWRRYSKVVYAKCLWFLRDASAAEDVTADVFVKVIASLRAQYRPYHFAGWLFTVGRHECINHVKQAAERLRGGNTDDLHLVAPGDPTRAADIESVLSRLSAPQRIAIKLFCANRYSYEEIAALEGWTLKEVKAHLQNGRRRFKLFWDRTAQGTGT